MPDFNDFSSLYDWSKLEKAVQDYFVASESFVAPPGEDDSTRETWTPEDGVIPFFTALEDSLFQKHRPRVSVDINEISPRQLPVQGIVDANGVIRNQAWKANMSFSIVTKPHYGFHTALRAQVISLGELIAPMVANPDAALGVNQYLELHQFNSCIDMGNSTGIHAEDGYYISTVNFQIIFSVQRSKWPGGTQ